MHGSNGAVWFNLEDLNRLEFVDATEPAASIHKSVVMGEQTCFLHAAMRGHYQTTLRLELNGHDVPLPPASRPTAG